MMNATHLLTQLRTAGVILLASPPNALYVVGLPGPQARQLPKIRRHAEALLDHLLEAARQASFGELMDDMREARRFEADDPDDGQILADDLEPFIRGYLRALAAEGEPQ